MKLPHSRVQTYTEGVLRYAITDRSLLDVEAGGDRLEALVEQCVRLAREGVDYLQLREKDLPPQELAEVSRRVLDAIGAAGGRMRLLINGNLDVALAAGAAGLHVSSGAARILPAEVRERFREAGLAEPFVSVSCHGLEEVWRAREAGASAVLFGPVFGKTAGGVEVVGAVGLEALRSACVEAGEIPVLALGGVTAERVEACLEVGAAGVAAIRMFLDGNVGSEDG